MISVFILPSLSELRCAKRGAHRRAKGERERERTTHRHAKGERSRRRSRSREAPRWSRSREAPRRSRSREAPRQSQSCLRADRDLAKHRADRSPSSNPVASLSSFFSQFDRIWWFFFWVLFVFLYWEMNDIIYLFGNRENVTRFDDFFLGFICVSVLRNEWYYIFVWQPRKCEKIWATSRKCVFYGIFKNTTKHQKIFFETFFEMQPNTWKHFPFRKCFYTNQTEHQTPQQYTITQ